MSGAREALEAGDLDTAKTFIRKLLDTAAAALPADFAGSIDVVNEDVAGEFENRGWIAHAISWPFGSLLEFWRFCFREARHRWPKAGLFVCMNNTEEVGNSGYHQMARYQFLGHLKRAVGEGVDMDGVTLQCHCIFRRGTVDGRFVDYLKAIRGLGLRLRLGELDARSSEDPGQFIGDYDDERYTRLVAWHHSALLQAALPYVTDGVTLWTLSDADNSWKRNLADTQDSGERPCAFDADFQPKPQVVAAIAEPSRGGRPRPTFRSIPTASASTTGRSAATSAASASRIRTSNGSRARRGARRPVAPPGWCRSWRPSPDWSSG